ncbi:hypothetical protein Micbo1qcDRAFT_25467 [Microdochium bolleyi]|uniref:Uncharacterized protein n=1 Tax=Microdochium bolleyi TaxID=196109 RepID=A0A136JDQ6_9PEZI|nr:hypothetical protein Micbo1qcDRAFT_25467 [Microdochium bolleyi]
MAKKAHAGHPSGVPFVSSAGAFFAFQSSTSQFTSCPVHSLVQALCCASLCLSVQPRSSPETAVLSLVSPTFACHTSRQGRPQSPNSQPPPPAAASRVSTAPRTPSRNQASNTPGKAIKQSSNHTAHGTCDRSARPSRRVATTILRPPARFILPWATG